MLDERKNLVLSCVVDEYIKTGEPVASNLVLSRLGIKVSSATVRNDMAALEQLGYLEQPHTSAGRIPTYMGYRYYIDNIMMPKPLTAKEKAFIDSMMGDGDGTAQRVVDNAVTVLSELTQLAAVSKLVTPVFSVISKVDVIPIGRRLYVLLMITSSGAIKNKVCRMEIELSYEQIEFFEKLINDNITGIEVEKLNPAVIQSLAVALGNYMMLLSPLLNALYELTQEAADANVNLKGEDKLVESGVKPDDALALLMHKKELDSLLSSAFDGISVVFGKEKDSFTVTNSSLILSPYKVNEKQVGTLGVIGPIRIDYAKIIPHIQYITESMAKMLDSEADENKTIDNGKEERSGR